MEEMQEGIQRAAEGNIIFRQILEYAQLSEEEILQFDEALSRIPNESVR